MSANRNGECCDHHDHTEQSQQGSPIPVGAIKETFRVSGMDCSEEVAAIERALKPIGGILGVRANLVASAVTVYHDGSVQSATLIEAINGSGVRVQMDETPSRGGRISLASFLVGTSGLSTGIGIALHWRGLKETLWPDVAFIIAIIAGGTLVFPKGLRSLKTFSLDMNVGNHRLAHELGICSEKLVDCRSRHCAVVRLDSVKVIICCPALSK
jgi:copper chaperone CopZ